MQVSIKDRLKIDAFKSFCFSLIRGNLRWMFLMSTPIIISGDNQRFVLAV
jgi:hypothetical protein